MTFQKGKQKLILANLYAVLQKAENCVEDSLLGSDWELGLWKYSGTMSIDLF